MNSRFRDCLESSPVVDRGGYQYFINPLTDGVPSMSPEILEEVVEWMLSAGDFDCDILVTPESMGIPLAVPLALRLGIPYTVVRKRSYGLPGEVVFEQRTGYSRNTMSINGVKKGDRVVIVDDVISTGGTLDALVSALTDNIGARVVDVLVPVSKGPGTENVLERRGIPVKTMVDIDIVDGKVVCHTD
ncbi:MAG: hypoxanthine/guanine phosphoribosyltransferase [archaeon]|nr:hypoxanthine/guanine phosphoribosyltransferase [archaeon]